jgi:hypothetical protein
MIYLVTAETGEYSDHQEWIVHAYRYRQEAERHAKAANHWCERHGCDRELSASQSLTETSALDNPLDPEFRTDYTGTIYNVTEVESWSRQYAEAIKSELSR